MNSNKAIFVLGISLIISSLIFGIFYFNKRPLNSITVVGLAKDSISSDRIKWSLTISRQVGLNDKQSYVVAQKEYLQLVNFLLNAGIKNDEIIRKPLISNPNYSNNGINGYILDQTLVVISDNLALVEKFAFDLTPMYQQNSNIKSSNVEYFVSDLSEKKQELLRKATLDAKKRAESIVLDSDSKLGVIQEAKVGVFQITEPYSVEFASYGLYNTSVKEKDISVTVRVTFELK